MASPQPVTPGPAEVRAIVAEPNRILRNLRITECYGRLSASMQVLTGSAEANWCTFATWASRQAGCTIRGEDMGDRLNDVARATSSLRHPIRSFWRMLLRRGLFDGQTRLGRLVNAIHTPFDAFERASEAVADGNRKVFEEIGYEFARYLAVMHDPATRESFIASLKPGPAPAGQDLLRSAFTHYGQALACGNPAERAQWTLLANLEIGFHEQTRLQPEIARALDAGPDTADDLKQRLLAHFGLSWFGRLAASVLAYPAGAWRRFVREVTRRVICETLMVLRTPAGTLELGRNIDVPRPTVFETFTEPELNALIARVEPHASTCTNCGAEDWASLPQRMHYIFHLFAAFHQTQSLFEPPFSAGQVAEMRAGRIPAGTL